MVELAFIVIILTMMLVGTLELGRAFSAWIQVGNMARAGAQYGSIAGVMGDPLVEQVENAVLEEQDSIYGVPPTVASEVYKDEYGYCAVRVTVSYDFSPLVTMNMFPDTLTMSRTSDMRLQFVSAHLKVPDEENACR